MMSGKTFDIYSEKYKTHGKILDYEVVIKLVFSYEGREYTLGLSRPSFDDNELAPFGCQVMETTIEKLVSDHGKTALHYWYIDDNNIAHGVVTGHKKMPDALRIHTSEIVGAVVDHGVGEVVITTGNTVYHCPLNYCRFDKQDMFPDAIVDYEKLKKLYMDKLDSPEIEQGKVLLVLADFAEYYFHSLCVKNKNGKRVEYLSQPHIGTFQDSFLIRAECADFHIDLRYFPHYGNISFYSKQTGGMPLYAENIGNSTIYVEFEGEQFSITPGERKELCKSNAEKEELTLPNGDLYPTVVL